MLSLATTQHLSLLALKLTTSTHSHNQLHHHNHQHNPRVPTHPKMESLAQLMFGSVKDGVVGLAKKAGIDLDDQTGADEADAASAANSARRAPASIDEAVAEVDARAQTGDLNFDDFLLMGKAFNSMDGSMPLPQSLSDAQVLETREKFARHERIVEAMLADERAEPAMLIEDLKAGGENPGPRIQRLSTASGEAVAEVALFLMQFEAMRESTARIAAGEDPDEVNESMMAGPGSNRAARRQAKKTKAKSKSKKAGP